MMERDTTHAPNDPRDHPGGGAAPEDDARPGHSGALVLCAIVLLALALRVLGLDYLLPHQAEPDGNVIVTQARLLESGAPHPERELLFGFYPTLIARLAGVLPRQVADGAARPASHQPSAPRELEAQLSAASGEYLRVRIVVALLSLLIVPGTWLLARRFMGPGGALCAALLMATSVLDLWFAQQARPHAASAAFALLAVVAALNLRRRGRPIDYVAAGLALGLAVASLQSGIAVLLPLAAAVLLRSASARRASLLWIFAALALALVFVLLFYPFLLAPSQNEVGVKLAVDEHHFNLWGHIIYFELFRGEGFARVWRTLCGYEPWIFGLSILGGVLALARVASRQEARDAERLKDLAVVLSYAIPYFVVIGLYARTYQRFVIPILPYLACLAAYAIVRIAGRVGARRTAVSATAALVLLAPQVVAAFRLVTIRRARDTATLAAEWLTQNLKPGEDKILVQYPLELPLPSTRDALNSDDGMLSDLKHPWVLYQRGLPEAQRLEPAWNMVVMPMRADAQRAMITHDPVAYLKLLQGDYAVIDVYEGGRTPIMLNAIPPALRQVGDLVARFSPDSVDGGSNAPIMHQDDEYPGATPWLWRVLRARCTGPVIEIYKLRR